MGIVTFTTQTVLRQIHCVIVNTTPSTFHGTQSNIVSTIYANQQEQCSKLINTSTIFEPLQERSPVSNQP